MFERQYRIAVHSEILILRSFQVEWNKIVQTMFIFILEQNGIRLVSELKKGTLSARTYSIKFEGDSKIQFWGCVFISLEMCSYLFRSNCAKYMSALSPAQRRLVIRLLMNRIITKYDCRRKDAPGIFLLCRCKLLCFFWNFYTCMHVCVVWTYLLIFFCFWM